MRAAKRPVSTAADATRRYVDDHASLREGLREDILNYASVARKIQLETGLANEEAVTIALRRYQRTVTPDPAVRDAARELVSKSRLEVHYGVAIVRMRDSLDVLDRLLVVGRQTLATPAKRRVFELFVGSRATTILCEEPFLASVLPEIPAKLLLSVERGLGTLALRGTLEVQDTPGVIAYLADELFRRGINAVEVVSVHTDSLFVFRDADLLRAYQVLSGLAPSDVEELGPPRVA
jgi:hypothetical protein